MAIGLKKQYELPESLDVSNYECWVVRVPAAPEYRRAFLDSWYHLTTWLAWRRDGNQSGARAASLFRRFTPRRIDCAIVDEIDSEGNMAINVNVTCNCGGGCCGGGSDSCLPGGLNPQLPIVRELPEYPPEENIGEGETTLTEQELCDLGTYLYMSFDGLYEDAEQNWEALALTVDSMYLWLTERWPIGSASWVTFSLFVLGHMLAAFTILRLDNLLDNVLVGLRNNKDALICAIADNTNASDARGAWFTALAQIRLDQGNVVYSLLWAQSHLWSWDALYNGEVLVPEEYQNSTCTCGGGESLQTIRFDFEESGEGFFFNSRAGWFESSGPPPFGYIAIWTHSGFNGRTWATWNNTIGPKVSGTGVTSARLVAIRFSGQKSPNGTFENDIRVTVDEDGATPNGSHTFVIGHEFFNSQNFTEFEYTLAEQTATMPISNGKAISIWNQPEGNTDNGIGFWFDWIEFDLEITFG